MYKVLETGILYLLLLNFLLAKYEKIYWKEIIPSTMYRDWIYIERFNLGLLNCLSSINLLVSLWNYTRKI